jgi:membrane protein insertase Oxa1/YidC/SpoIIIJ
MVFFSFVIYNQKAPAETPSNEDDGNNKKVVYTMNALPVLILAIAAIGLIVYIIIKLLKKL